MNHKSNTTASRKPQCSHSHIPALFFRLPTPQATRIFPAALYLCSTYRHHRTSKTRNSTSTLQPPIRVETLTFLRHWLKRWKVAPVKFDSRFKVGCDINSYDFKHKLDNCSHSNLVQRSSIYRLELVEPQNQKWFDTWLRSSLETFPRFLNWVVVLSIKLPEIFESKGAAVCCPPLSFS